MCWLYTIYKDCKEIEIVSKKTLQKHMDVWVSMGLWGGPMRQDMMHTWTLPEADGTANQLKVYKFTQVLKIKSYTTENYRRRQKKMNQEFIELTQNLHKI